MHKLQVRGPMLTALIGGLGEVAILAAANHTGFDSRIEVALLLVVIFTSGWLSRDAPWWSTWLVLLAPTLFLGGPHHGYVYQWILIPSLWPYLLFQVGPIWVAVGVFVWLGRLAGRTVQAGRSSIATGIL